MMNLSCRARGAITALLFLLPAAGAQAQRATDNPVLSADDAFGMTLGLESTGLYGQNSIRGFNPQSAGNMRINGLYFDQQGPISQRIIESSSVRIGLGEIGYAFPAPTGIVDYDLRHSGDGKPMATIIAEIGPFAARSLNVDGSVPILGRQLEVPLGVSLQADGPSAGSSGPGYDTATTANIGAAPVWRPNDQVTVRLFADWQDTTNARTSQTVFPAGSVLPPRLPHRYLGPSWGLQKLYAENYGGLVEAKLDPHWSLAAGVFHSVSAQITSFVDLLTDVNPDGSARHLLLGQPPQRMASTSGEIRLTNAHTFGRWAQQVIVMARGRDAQSFYGGNDAVDLGITSIFNPAQIPEPDFVHGSRTADHTQLYSVGAAYRLQRAGLGELSFGAQKQFYDKNVVTPGIDRSHLTDQTVRLYVSGAATLPGKLVLYSDYTQGFEDSGSAPTSAANGGEILPTSRTWQLDGGLRYPVTGKLNLIAGYFVLNRPYFNFDSQDVERQLGVQRASGIELSASGQVATGLNVNVGALLGQVHVIGANLAAEGVGTAAVGQPHVMLQANAVYALPHLPWSVDAGYTHFSREPADTSNSYYVPANNVVNLGARYQFRLARAPATLRLQVQNLFDEDRWMVANNPGLSSQTPRAYLGYLTVDLQ